MPTLKDVSTLYARLEEELGVPPDWCTSLVREEDWSFVIKLQALIEAALTHLLIAKIGHSQLRRFVESMNMGGQSGKLEMAQGLGLLELEHVKFIRILSAMRNACVHDVRNVRFNVETYLSKRPAPQRTEAIQAMRDLIYKPRTPQEEAAMQQIVEQNPKIAMFLAGLNLLAQFYRKKELAAEIAQQNRRMLEQDKALTEWGRQIMARKHDLVRRKRRFSGPSKE